MNTFNKNSAGLIADFAFYAVDVINLGVLKTLGKGEEVVVEIILSRSGKRGDGSSVERVFKRNDLVSAVSVFIEAVFSRDFYSAFVSLRTAVGEARLFKMRELTEFLGELGRLFAVKIVAHMLDSVKLSAYRLYPAVVTVTERVYADTRAYVKIFFTVFV